MPEDVQIHGKAGDMAFLYALNIVIDALVSHRPEYQAEIANRLNAKIAELKTSPGLEEVAPALEVIEP